MIRYIGIAVGIVCLGSCSRPAAPTMTTTTLVPVVDKEELAPYGYINGMWGMAFHQDRLYLPDWSGSRILVTDPDLVPLMQIGRPGVGPGELANVSFVTVADDRVFVKSGGSARLSVFHTSGAFLQWIPIPDLLLVSRFAVYEETLYLSSPNLDPPILAMDIEGRHLFGMGENRFGDDFAVKRARNGAHLAIAHLPNRPVVVAVGLTEPEVALYALDGALLHRADLRTNPHLLARLDESRAKYKDPANRATSVMLFDDIAVVGDQLWALVYSGRPPHKILRFHLSDSQVDFVAALQVLEDVHIPTFATNGADRLFLFDTQTNATFSYQMPL